MSKNERRITFEHMLNSIEEAKDCAESLGDDLIINTIDGLLRELNDQYDEEQIGGAK